MTDKIKIAFVKFCGLSAGGTEKALQTIAAHLPSDRFQVDYYYCDAAPYVGSSYKHSDTDVHRKKYMESTNVNLIKFNVGFKDVTKPTHDWVQTDFWDKFNEDDYDIIQTARAGHSEYPFTHINKIPQIDLITLPGMAENKPNVFKTVHKSQFQANSWVQAGGNENKIEIIPLFDELPPITKNNLKKKLGLENVETVFGMHQRADDGIFSPAPLLAYSKVQSEKTAFVLLGGSELYRQQAKELGLKEGLNNFFALPHTGDKQKIHEFLQTLDVYTHGHKDGETYSLAIAEAMYHGLPIISHIAPAMGHQETMGSGGVMTKSVEEYVEAMKRMRDNTENIRTVLSENSKKRFEEHLSLEKNMDKWISLYESCAEKARKERQYDSLSDEEFWQTM